MRERLASGVAVCTALGTIGTLMISIGNQTIRRNIEGASMQVFSIEPPRPEVVISERPKSEPDKPQPKTAEPPSPIPVYLPASPLPAPVVNAAPLTRPAPTVAVTLATTSASTPSVAVTTSASAPAFITNPSCSIPRPAYPTRAKRLRQTGTVLIAMTIAPDGRIMSQTVRKSSGFDALDTAAITAVRAGRCRNDTYASTVGAELPIAFTIDK